MRGTRAGQGALEVELATRGEDVHTKQVEEEERQSAHRFQGDLSSLRFEEHL